MKNSMVHFEIPADDVDRAKEFYTKTFGWKIEKHDMPEGSSTNGEPYYGVQTVDVGEDRMPKEPGGINGGLMKRMSPDQPFMNYISVDSIEEALEAVKANGGTVAMEKTEIAPGMGWIGAFMDTENNLMGVHEMGKKE